MKQIFLNLALCLVAMNAFTQSVARERMAYPEVGKPMPDLTISNIEYYTRKQSSIKDFNGKWLILDFWNKNCISCVTSFPKINELLKEFEGEAEFIMVARDQDEQTRRMYAKYRDKFNLKMPCAFDSNLYTHRLDISAAPYIIIIDGIGVVRTITTTLTSNKIKELLAEKNPVFDNAYRTHEARKKKYDYNRPLFISENGGHDTSFLFRSILAKWDTAYSFSSPGEINQFNIKTGRLEFVGISLEKLYMYAFLGVKYTGARDSFYGNYWGGMPILEIEDSSMFMPEIATGRNLYSYSLIIPPGKAGKEYFQILMQQDLERYFGFKAKLENRNMPYWSLVASGKAATNLRSKCDTTSVKWFSPHTGFEAKKLPIKKFIQYIMAQQSYREPPIINESGIEEDIDITFECIMTDLEDVKRALKENGLDLVKRERLMKVIVIRD